MPPQSQTHLKTSLNNLAKLIQSRLGNNKEDGVAPSQLVLEDSHFPPIVQNGTIPSMEENIILALALAPHVQAGFIEQCLEAKLNDYRFLLKFCGVAGKNYKGIMATGETALFLLAGEDLEKRREIRKLFSTEHWFYKKGVLRLEETPFGEPEMSGRLLLDREYRELLTRGRVSIPPLSTSFPAQEISTQMEWNDLVLNSKVLEQIKELQNWVKHNDTFMNDWFMSRKTKQGYRALFYGSPGTGKTLTASLLGKYTGRKVLRIDLSMVVSKYIGETEKNLANLFNKAQNKDWILFFDEADALFGKRTNVNNAHDRYANQEVSYLLQRIENYPGLAILASNYKRNIDNAFSRRFNSIIHFPIPRAEERLLLWQKAFPKIVQIDASINFPQLAKRYEVTGANIANIVHTVCIYLLANDRRTLHLNDLMKGLEKEYQKEGRVM